MSNKEARVGIGVFIFKNGKFLILKRLGSHGGGTWSVPGGHLEFGETFEQTAGREVMEEVGIKIKNIRFGAVTNDVFKETNKHYVTVWMLSDWQSGHEKILEPDKCVELKWIDFSELPRDNLFLPWNQLLESSFINAIQKELKAS